MTEVPPALEVRLKRGWRFFVAIAVPAFALLMVGASAAVLAKPPVDVVDILSITFFVLGLGGLLVVPGTLLLARQARGIPDVRLDPRGIVWGNDRDREQSVDWVAIAGVTSKTMPGNVPERAFILRLRSGRSGKRATSAYGRILAITNRMRYGTPWAISTVGSDKSWEEIRRHLGLRLPGVPFDQA